MSDLKFAFRQLLKNPGFTAVAVISLALGIAANTTIFSFVNALLLRPPPVREPKELWQIWRFRANASSEIKRHGPWSRAAIAHFCTNSATCAAIAAFDGEPTLTSWNNNGTGESAQCLFVSGNFFQVCGIQPTLGRLFIPEEDRAPGTHPSVVVSHRFWQTRLGAEDRAVGRSITVNGVALTIIGVTPSKFNGVMAGVVPDLWVPFMMAPAVLHQPGWLTRTDSHSAIGLARLKEGVTATQAAAELTTLTRWFDEQRGRESIPADGAALLPALLVPTPVRGYVRAFTAILMGAVVLVLLIACANAANLLLARATARRQEMAVRAALGAARRRLIHQLLTESVLLAAMAGGLGLLLSVWLSGLLGQLIPSSLPLRFSVTFDWRVMAFTAGVSLATGIIFGVAPAFRGTQINLASTLKDEARSLAVRRSRLANSLIAGQVALSLVLLVGAMLCLRSLMNARAFDPGFQISDRVAASFNLNHFGYTAEQAQKFYIQLVERIRTSPGVRSAAMASHLPLGTERSNGSFQIEGRPAPAGENGFFFEQFNVGPGYFATMGTRVLQGREFTEADRPGSLRVAIINEAAANRYWPGENPIGRRLIAGETSLEIIGIVQTGRYQTLGEEPKAVFYECFNQRTDLGGTLVAHIEGAAAPQLTAIRAAVHELDARLAPTRLTTLEQHLSLALFPMRTSGLLLGVLGLVALVLAVSGLFGVIAYSVSQRAREVGIRMALGAQPGDVLRLVLNQGMKLAGIGVVLGLIGAFGAAQLLRKLLFGVTATDPVTFAGIPLLLLGAAWLACWLPARRAARLDPVAALRSE